MRVKLMGVVVGMALIPSLVVADIGSSIDNRGCWDGLTAQGDGCLYNAGGELRNGRVTSKFGNKCGNRIYARYCNEKLNGSWECGVSGIRPGAVKSWSTSKATGRNTGHAIGSVDSGKDWSCSSDYANWDTP